MISEAFLSKSSSNCWPRIWPKTRIVVGELDPLLDDAVRLCSRMADSNVDVRLKIFRELGHGCMSVETVVKEGERVIQASIKQLR